MWQRGLPAPTPEKEKEKEKEKKTSNSRDKMKNCKHLILSFALSAKSI
jgi:hypothetical protein